MFGTKTKHSGTHNKSVDIDGKTQKPNKHVLFESTCKALFFFKLLIDMLYVFNAFN